METGSGCTQVLLCDDEKALSLSDEDWRIVANISDGPGDVQGCTEKLKDCHVFLNSQRTESGKGH